MNLGYIQRYIPIFTWGKQYTRQLAVSDATAAVIVTLMLVPQALAYAILSGLPPQIGLYASMLPLVMYGIFGTSNTLAVGPVAVAALMTASTIKPFSDIDPALGVAAAVILSAISGLFLLSSGVLRLGFLANLLSHSVIAGFISAASIVIATSQLSTLLGFSVKAENMTGLVSGIWEHIHQTHLTTLILSAFTLGILLFARQYGSNTLEKMGLSTFWSRTISRSVPAFLVILGTLAIKTDMSWMYGVKTVGGIPAGLPTIGLPLMDFNMWHTLLLPAVLISIIGYVESISVAQNLAMKRRERIDPDQELIALGFANIAAGITSALPVTGGVSRSVVNMDAGAKTPAAGLLTAFGMLVATYFIAAWLSDLPRFILAATIIVAVLSLFDAKVFKHTWHLSKRDFMSLCVTFFLTLFVNVEMGIATGVLLSILLHLYKTCRPHIAIVGLVKGTEHFRNIDRHNVELCNDVVTMRVDESLYFVNARFLEQRIYELLADSQNIKHLILMFSAVNDVDGSAIEVLEALNAQLKLLGIGFHLSEVKGPVMDSLEKSGFINKLFGKVFLTQFKAYQALSCFNAGSA
jgi:sulfate permease, SulP family